MLKWFQYFLYKECHAKTGKTVLAWALLLKSIVWKYSFEQVWRLDRVKRSWFLFLCTYFTSNSEFQTLLVVHVKDVI